MSAQSVTRRKGAATIIDSPDQAEVLAAHLLDPRRSKPAVVVTVATGQSQPYIDVSTIIDAVSELADVYVLPTGNVTFAMRDGLPERTEVYGGAGRVYPIDNAWQTDPYAAPLRFAFGESQGLGATDKLIADALGAAHSAGLDATRVGATVIQVKGRVKALFPPSCAMVWTDDNRHAAIWPELILAGLKVERAFRVGMRISGALDVEEGRVDVSASLKKPADALGDYVVRAVVLARVVKLDAISARVELYPGVSTEMSAKDVTGNPMDRLTSLMSVDEVLPVRITARGGHDGRGWRVSTFDVEDTEAIVPPPSLLPGGPPWLEMAQEVPETSTVPLGMSTVPLRTERTEPADIPGDVLSIAHEPHRVPLPSSAHAAEMEAMRRQIAQLDVCLQRSRRLEGAFQFERDGFRGQLSESYARVKQLVQSAEKMKTDLRLEKQKSPRLEKQVRSAKTDGKNGYLDSAVLFLDPEARFRYDVDVAYAHRIPASDKVDRPGRKFRVGPEFLATLSLDGVDRSKAVAVTVEIITDLVNELDGRDLHPLREGQGSAERDVVRTSDGARCMRVALQRKTRLHFWKVGETVELSRVVIHDDMTP